jgi:hypothetical protein
LNVKQAGIFRFLPAVFTTSLYSRYWAVTYWTVKCCVLAVTPPALVTVIEPLVAPAGTVAVMN